MSKKISIILLSFVSALLFALPTFAVPVGDGQNGSTSVEVNKPIDRIFCDYSNPQSGKITMYAVDGTQYQAIYGSSTVNHQWCLGQIVAVAQNLYTAGLVKTADNSRVGVVGEPSDKTIAMLDLQNATTGGAGGSGGAGGGTTPTPSGGGVNPDNECTSILPPSWCDPNSGDGIVEILSLILTIMTFGIGVLATIGLVISGIQWLTARDKEDQIVKAKSRIFNIVIGLAVWGIMWLLLSWLLPGGINLEITTTP